MAFDWIKLETLKTYPSDQELTDFAADPRSQGHQALRVNSVQLSPTKSVYHVEAISSPNGIDEIVQLSSMPSQIGQNPLPGSYQVYAMDTPTIPLVNTSRFPDISSLVDVRSLCRQKGIER